MKPALHLKLHQQCKMTAELQQAIRLLQLSSTALEQEVQQMLEKNPLLEPAEATEPFSLYQHQSSIDYLSQASTETTLRQHLLAQVELAHFSPDDKIIAIALIDAISDEGYLVCSLAEVQQNLGIKMEQSELEAILSRIQQFDPPGVGARSLAECLNIQLNALPSSLPWIKETKLLVLHYLETLGKRDYPSLKAALKLDNAALNACLRILGSLNPKPGSQISHKASQYLIPDVIAVNKNGQLLVELNKGLLPKLRINPTFSAFIEHAKRTDNLYSFKTHLKEAKFFLKALQTRDSTLLKVARNIMEQQQAFLQLGEAAIKPLDLRKVAQAVSLHESTVSRVTTQKYILTPHGMFALKYFFSNGAAIRALIRKIIHQESIHTPLSDDKITKLLGEQGIDITRRTVTKYREAMHIPSSIERKKLIFNQKGACYVNPNHSQT